MFGYFLIAFIVLLVPLSYFYGKDSRVDEHGRTRRDVG